MTILDVFFIGLAGFFSTELVLLVIEIQKTYSTFESVMKSIGAFWLFFITCAIIYVIFAF